MYEYRYSHTHIYAYESSILIREDFEKKGVLKATFLIISPSKIVGKCEEKKTC